MICVYDLYDLHSIWTGIRYAPDSAINGEMMRRVVQVLNQANRTDSINQFRIAIRPLLKKDQEGLYSFASVENVYTYFPLPFLKDEKILQLLLVSCNRLLDAICEKNREKVRDLADCLHGLPILLAENRYAVPDRFWENEVREYRKRWDAVFLVNEEKIVRK